VHGFVARGPGTADARSWRYRRLGGPTNDIRFPVTNVPFANGKLDYVNNQGALLKCLQCDVDHLVVVLDFDAFFRNFASQGTRICTSLITSRSDGKNVTKKYEKINIKT
jgi:hypothetical protein